MIKGVATPSWITKRRVIGAFLATLLLVVISFAVRTYAASGDQPAKDTGIVITLHDRGLERVFVTSAATVGDALKQADIEVDARDKVEPALTDQLVANEYTINIYRARPLVVIDGALRQKVITASQVPESIAKDAGITLYPEDVTALRQSDNLIRDGASEQFVVTRATPFTFTLYGETYTARTQAKTVGAMLKEKGISLGENDRTSEPLSTPISKDMSLRVWREGKQTITVDEAVDFEVEKIQDANRPTGYREVKTPGTKGERTVTYEVVVEDGKEVSRVEITSVTKKPAEKQVEIVGTKPEYMPYTGGGSKTEWLSAAGIPSEYWGYADWLVQKESGWNPNATNRSSGACGLAQALPCGKVPGNPLNPVDSLRWMNSYVNGRYGGWSGAVSHSKQKGWY